MDLIQADTQCLVCTRPFSLSSSPPITSLESLAICSDCKQTVLSNTTRPVTPTPTRFRRHRARLTRTESTTDYSSPDPDSFAQQFTQIINSAAQSNSSNRWQGLSSDNESEIEGSVYGESEIDGSSFGNYGGESEAYNDMSDREFFAQFDHNVSYSNRNNNDNNNNGNYDIDPMNTGFSPSQWDTEEESEWEEISELDETLNSINTPERQYPNFVSNPNLSPSLSPSPQWMRSRWRMGPLQIDITQPFLGFPDDSINPNLFEELIDDLAEESDSVRISGPRATSESFRERIPKVVITREMMRESGDLICAVCKDEMKVGIRVSKLPCHHMYHDCCIDPWLSSRNTCPVCRYELPVEKNGIEIERFEYDSNGEDSDSETDQEEEQEEEDQEQEIVIRMEGQDRARSEERGGWMFLGPIVSLVGIVLVLCFKNVNRGNGEDRRRNGDDLNGGFVNRGNLEGRKRWWSIF